MNDLAKRIEAVIFMYGEAVSIERLSKILGEDKTKIRQAVEELDRNLSDTALVVVWKDDSLQLAARPALSKDISTLIKEEVSREISKASAETLAVIAYRGPITRAEIDYIRGVNSSYTLRNLLMRGLIERSPNPKDARTYIYRSSIELLKFLGVSKIEELPDHKDFSEKFEKFLSTQEGEEK